MHSSERQLRLLIREQFLFEALQAPEAETLIIDEINSWLDRVEWGLVAVEVGAIAVGGATAVPTAGGAVPVSATILKMSGFISAGISAFQAVSYLLHPKGPQWDKFAIELLELCVGLFSSTLAAKATRGGVKIALELVGPVSALCKKLYNKMYGSLPPPEEEAKIEQAVRVAAQNASAVGKPAKVIDVNEILTNLAIDDSNAGTISEPGTVELEIIQAGGPEALVKKESDRIYGEYLQIRNGLDTDSGAPPALTSTTSRIGKSTRVPAKNSKQVSIARPSEIEIAAVEEIPAKDYKFDPYDGEIQYEDPRGGIRLLGDVRSMAPGTKITPALTLFRVDYDDQGNVAAVKLKNPMGKILNVKNMYM